MFFLKHAFMVICYVDEFLLFTKDTQSVAHFKRHLKTEFVAKDLGYPNIS